MLSLIIVGFLWGSTNPLLRRGASGVEDIKKQTVFGQVISELFYLFTKWQYLVPFLLNQVGFLVYYVSLQSYDLSLAVPTVNSLTFFFTAITGWILGESAPNFRSSVGMLLILGGITCYIFDKIEKSHISD